MAMQSGFIKRIRDIMRMDAGINGDAQRIEQMVWMLFLKVYDAKEDDWELNEDNYEYVITDRCDSPYGQDMPYLNEEIIYSLRNCLLHQSTPSVEQSKIHESRCKVDKFELVITGEDGANGDLSMVAYGKDMNIVRRELKVHISHLCYILCTAAEDYYKNNKEKFDFIKYSIEDDRPNTFL